MEETEPEIEVQKCSQARFDACRNQCRIQKFINGGTIFDGGCPCDIPNECWFNLQEHITELDHTMLWPDVKKIYREWNTE